MKHEEPKRTDPIEVLNGIGIRGKPDSKGGSVRKREEHDLAEVTKVLVHVEVDTSFTHIVGL